MNGCPSTSMQRIACNTSCRSTSRFWLVHRSFAGHNFSGTRAKDPFKRGAAYFQSIVLRRVPFLRTAKDEAVTLSGLVIESFCAIPALGRLVLRSYMRSGLVIPARLTWVTMDLMGRLTPHKPEVTTSIASGLRLQIDPS